MYQYNPNLPELKNQQPTCNNPNDETIADYGCDDDGGEGECPEQVYAGPVQH